MPSSRNTLDTQKASLEGAEKKNQRVNVLLVLGAYLVAVLLSAGQIHFRLYNENANPSWWRLLGTNLIAWAPWPLLSPLIARVWSRFSPLGIPLHIVFHLVASTVTAIAYMLYLTAFRFLFFSSFTGPLTPAGFSDVLAREIGQFFVVSWGLYWCMGVACQMRRSHRPQQEAEANEEAETDRPKPFMVRSLGRVVWVQVEAIEWIEADRSYVTLHTAEKSHTYRETMTKLADELADSGFVRIHRSSIVNTSRIKELQPYHNGEYFVVLNGGTRLKLSRGYKDKLGQILGEAL